MALLNHSSIPLTVRYRPYSSQLHFYPYFMLNKSIFQLNYHHIERILFFNSSSSCGSLIISRFICISATIFLLIPFAFHLEGSECVLCCQLQFLAPFKCFKLPMSSLFRRLAFYCNLCYSNVTSLGVMMKSRHLFVFYFLFIYIVYISIEFLLTHRV